MNARLALITIIGLILILVVGVLLHDEETGAIMA
jgi:preprotein translocase subunit SecG